MSDSLTSLQPQVLVPLVCVHVHASALSHFELGPGKKGKLIYYRVL